MSYSIVEKGCANSLDYRVYFHGTNGIISPFHDIPLYADNTNMEFNMIVEVPRWTNAKMEIDTKSRMNPIKQDIKKDALRYVKNCFPHHGYIWNYGAFPQTWEDPKYHDDRTDAKGDNDPLDVCEIGSKIRKLGDVIHVKVLGCLAMIDDGETDWKIIAIDVNDDLAPSLNNINDIETHMPGFLKATHEWFMIYKIPDGKPKNQFAFNGQFQTKDFALDIIKETHNHWQKLMNKQVDPGCLSCENVTIMGSPYRVTPEEARQVLDKAATTGSPLPLPDIVDKWYFITNCKDVQ